MSYNLGNVDAMTYNGNEVETLTLDGTTIWEGLKDYSISVIATFDEETRMITVTVNTGKDLRRWNYEASLNGNKQFDNPYHPIYISDTKTIKLGRNEYNGELSPIAIGMDGTWDISVTGWPYFHETYENSGPKSTTVEVTTPVTLAITNLTPDATMQHRYVGTWGSEGHDDGAIIKIDEPSDRNIDLYRLKITDQRTGELIRNWHNAHRFRVYEDSYYFGLPATHRAFKIIWGWSATTSNETNEGYTRWQTIGKKGGGILRFFIEKDSDNDNSNNATADSSIAGTAAPEGQRIWDCIRDIHANPSSYEVIRSGSTYTDVDTQMTALLPVRIVDDFTKITFNKYFYSIPQSGSGGSFTDTLLEFTKSPQKYTVQVRGYDYSTSGWIDYLAIPFENSNKLDITLTAVGLPSYSRQFGLPESHNPKTTREPSLHQEWTYTIPAGMKSIEVIGVGGGGGSWAAHDGGYGQNTRPGGAGSGFIAKFESVQLKEGDVLSGHWGSAGGSGYYNGGVGAAGSETTLKLNGTLLVTAHPGGNASASASGANGVSIKASGWDSLATSLTLHQGTAYTGVLYGGDGSCPACGYDPWGYLNSGSYNISHIGEPVFGESYGGLAQMTGYIMITELEEEW